MNELIINLHMHTTYSDGSGTHADLCRAALKTGVDVLLVTDHNVWVQGVDGYCRDGNKRILIIACEEIHDQDRDPQKNHLLVFGADQELATLADSPQTLIRRRPPAGWTVFPCTPGRSGHAGFWRDGYILGGLGCQWLYRDRIMEWF